MNAPCPAALGMILKGYPRISETFVSNEILLLEKSGIPVHIFSMRPPRESLRHESIKKIRARVDYLPETLLSPLPLFLAENLKLAAKIPRSYARAFQTMVRRSLRTRRSTTLKHLFQAGYLVNRLLPGLGVCHFHAHFAHSPASVAMFASQLAGLPFSFTAHAKDIYTSDPVQLREKIALARFVVTCTEYNRKYLASLARNTETPIHRIYHGIDTSLFENGEPQKAPAPPYRILTVARLTAKKGLPTVYGALRNLHDRGIPFSHILIGDGDDREQILSLIGSLGLEGCCRWLGTQPHRVVLEHYRCADLFALGCEVAPNGDRDGIPNVFLESMAMGVPVVSTRVSAVSEVIENERTGLLVAPGDSESMAGQMLRMLTDTDLREGIISLARNRILKDFDNRILTRQLILLFRKAGVGNAHSVLCPVQAAQPSQPLGRRGDGKRAREVSHGKRAPGMAGQ